MPAALIYPKAQVHQSTTQPGDYRCNMPAFSPAMAAPMKDPKIQSSSLAAPAAVGSAAAHSTHPKRPVYLTDAAPSIYSTSSLPPSNHTLYHHSERPKHPSLARVKGRSNMFTPPRPASEISWFKDQSPVHASTSTPDQCKTPEPGTPTLVNPASTLLQDLLKEQRAHRSSRSKSPQPDDWGNVGPRTPDGTYMQDEMASDKVRKVTEAFATGQRKPKEMGMREMDQYVSKMNKLNFDLKLEIHHRSEQINQLREKVQRMEQMEAELQRMRRLEEEVLELRSVKKDNQRLQQENDLLNQELKKRDVAVTEAVQLICQLETKVEELESSGRMSQMSMPRLVLDGPNVTTPKAQSTIEIPERTSSKRNSASLTRSIQSRSAEFHQLAKAPSFLREDNQSTATLRSLYIPENNVSHSAKGSLTKSESFNTLTDSPESPRLSALSECSELNQSELDEHDKLYIPLRRAPSTLSTASSLDSYVPPTEHEEIKSLQIDRWMGSQEDASDTIIRRRQSRAISAALNSVGPVFGGDSYSKKIEPGHPPLDALFGDPRLPPTPDTLSMANSGSNGSIAAQQSPKPGRGPWFAAPPLERHRSLDELASRRNINGTDSVQANCSDTPRLGATNQFSRTMLPYVNVADKASALLGPGSPNHPSSQCLGDPFPQTSNEGIMQSTVIRHKTPTKHEMSPTPKSKEFDEWDHSPPFTPTDWVAAAEEGPRTCKEYNSSRIINPAAFHDDQSVASNPTEPDPPGVPTLDMDALYIPEQPPAEVPMAEGSKPEPEQARRRISFNPRFFQRNKPTKSQQSPVANEHHASDDDDDGAPSPIVPKTRTAANSRRRPVSQIITNSADTNPPKVPMAHVIDSAFEFRTLHQSLMEARDNSQSRDGAATISGRPSTSHSTEGHKRRSSLSIFGWVRGKAGKRSEPASPSKAEKSKTKENDIPAWALKDGLPRSATPDSFDTSPVRPRSGMTMRSDDQGRRPRYVSRHSRRV